MRKNTIENMQKLAGKKKGECLSTTFENNKTKIKWKCEEKHEFLSKPNDVQQGHWCPECAKFKRVKKIRDTLENIQKLAKKFGGICLSSKYKKSTKKLEWQCKEGHKFEATPTKVKHRGQWCPYCRSRLIGEKICRGYFEAIFEKKFKKYKPKDLLSIRQTRLEFDGYNNKLNLAFEYHGAQHYRYVKKFHKNRSLGDQKTVDAYKIGYCMTHFIHLIEVPYTISYEDMGEFIIQEAKKKGFKIPKEKENINYHTFPLYVSDLIKEMEEIAKEKGGLCISKNYVDNLTLLDFKCSKGHVWKTTPKMIKKGHWCIYCAGNIPRNREEVRQVVESKQGTLISGDYVNNRSKMKVQCKSKHIWSTNLHELKAGGWCPQCYNKHRKKKN